MLPAVTAPAMIHLHHLSGEIGPRPLGSPGNLAAAAYITDVFHAAGLIVEEQSFDCPYWRHESTRLTLNGEALAAAANTFSPACEVTGPTIAISTLAELEAADLRGKIAVLYGDLAKEALLMKNFTLYEVPNHQRINAQLELKQPAAILTVGLSSTNEPIIQDWDFTIPSATIPLDAALILLRALGNTVTLRIQASRTPSRSATIVGTKPGARSERIILCAHYDTKYGTPGAFDNGSGTAALLALAEILSARDLPAGVELIAFTDEEYYANSHYEYLRHKGDTLNQVIAAINVDGIGHALGTNTITMLANSPTFRDEVDTLVKGYPGVVWTDPWYESNHSTFVWHGVPSIALTAPSRMHSIHLPTDTEDWISVTKLEEVVSLVTEIVTLLADKPLNWTRQQS